MVTISTTAARKIKAFLEQEKKSPDYGLRVGVKGGGCSGFSYVMDFDTQKDGDQVCEKDGVKVIVDAKSYLYLNGSEIDYAESLQGGGFTVHNPNVKGSCGCGSSFSV